MEWDTNVGIQCGFCGCCFLSILNHTETKRFKHISENVAEMFRARELSSHFLQLQGIISDAINRVIQF